MADNRDTWVFGSLVSAIRYAHEHMAAQAGRAVNISLTLRNWVIGCYIREYEQNGEDRAYYGRDLLTLLSRRRQEEGGVEYHPRELRRCRDFYCAYPQIRGTLSPTFDFMLLLLQRGRSGRLCKRLLHKFPGITTSHFWRSSTALSNGYGTPRQAMEHGWSHNILALQIQSRAETAKLPANPKELGYCE